MVAIYLMLLFATVSYALPIRNEREKLELLQRYLKNYYNFTTTDGKSTLRWKANSPIMKKIKEMQEFMGLEVTGSLDSRTLEAIQKPRCGNPDIGEFAFFSGQPKWGKKDLTYRILNYTPDMKERDVQNAVEKAFKAWSRVSPLTFSPTQRDNADIMISFGSRDHGDFNPFDGPGGTVAHAYAPSTGIGGDAHFDEDENWTHGLDGTNLYFVAVHEFGHSLGLFHSKDPNAVMFPVYRQPEQTDNVLSQDDIDGIQHLYGPSSNPSEDPVEDSKPREPIRPTQSAIPTACDPQLTFDAVTSLRGEILFFKNKHFWRKHPQYTQLDFSLISQFWSFVPTSVDAVSENSDKDEILLFKGNQFWAARGEIRLSGYPKRIQSLGFPKEVKKIDAAFFNANEKQTYYFSAGKYWRYDETTQTLERKPKNIKDGFPGIEGKVDAAFQHNGLLYFFRGTNQYEFDPNTRQVTRVRRANSWLSC
ncbi:stromelysin-1 [Pogona vitticeps]